MLVFWLLCGYCNCVSYSFLSRSFDHQYFLDNLANLSCHADNNLTLFVVLHSNIPFLLHASSIRSGERVSVSKVSSKCKGQFHNLDDKKLFQSQTRKIASLIAEFFSHGPLWLGDAASINSGHSLFFGWLLHAQRLINPRHFHNTAKNYIYGHGNYEQIKRCETTHETTVEAPSCGP